MLLKSFFLLSLLSCFAFSETFYVSTTADFRQALENAALNNQNDVIELSAGVYKTTADEIGTFIFSNDEEYNLTIQAFPGSTLDNVILDGDNADKVLNYVNSKFSTLTLKNISIINAHSTGSSSSDISAISVDDELIIENCHIRNSTGGKSVISAESIEISHSSVSRNDGYGIKTKALVMTGSEVNYNSLSGVYLVSDNSRDIGNVEIKDSNISFNTSNGIEVYRYSNIIINNTTVSNNQKRGISSPSIGGGKIAVYHSNISNNGTTGLAAGANVDFLIAHCNVDSNKYGLYLYNTARVALINSIISNTTEIAFVGNATSTGSTIIVNSIFAHNNVAVEGPGLLVNNIFFNNTQTDYETAYGKNYIFNNYIDYTKIIEGDPQDHTVLKTNNIQANQFEIYLDESYTIEDDSSLIDAGLNSTSEDFINYVEEFSSSSQLNTLIFDALQTDKRLNNRIINTTVDIGPYESGYGIEESPISPALIIYLL